MVDLAAIESLPLADSIRRSVWAYPVLEAIHISGFASMVGALLVLELRVFGAQRTLPLPALGRLVATIAAVAFVIAASCGVLMFISAATEIGRNPAFQAKLGLILIAALNAGWFHARGSLRRHDGVARGQALLSLVLWVGVIFAGRFIAYV